MFSLFLHTNLVILFIFFIFHLLKYQPLWFHEHFLLFLLLFLLPLIYLIIIYILYLLYIVNHRWRFFYSNWILLFIVIFYYSCLLLFNTFINCLSWSLMQTKITIIGLRNDNDWIVTMDWKFTFYFKLFYLRYLIILLIQTLLLLVLIGTFLFL